MENTYSLKINYNDLMNAFNRSLKLRANRQNPFPPFPPVPPVPPVPVRPTMTITSSTVTSGQATDDSKINLTFTSSEDTTDFTYSDVQISGGTISNFTGSGKVYTAVFTPSGYEKYTISVPENSFEDGSGNLNVASNVFEWTYTDTVRPTMTITSTTVESGEATDDSEINLTFTSSEDTTDFTSSDVQISGGTINFTGSGTGKVYTAVFTPSGYEKYTISVPENSFEDGSGNLNVASNVEVHELSISLSVEGRDMQRIIPIKQLRMVEKSLSIQQCYLIIQFYQNS